MSLVRYTHPMMGLQQQINRMFDQFDSNLFGHLEGLGEGMFAPPVDVKEDADAYTVHLEVPGVAQENLQLSLQDNVLTIRGTKEQKQETGEGRYRRVERSYGSFARSLSLPRNVDGSGVTANLEDGVLEVRLPKREESRPRQISVGLTQNAALQNVPVEGAAQNAASPQGASAPARKGKAEGKAAGKSGADNGPNGSAGGVNEQAVLGSESAAGQSS